uniref:Nitrate transporter n=2 Tax=Rhizophora mucronata TaxID=61149 RepID=A0A2P2LJT0_RHIMU
MCAFSVFVQAASGLTFGVVPFVSKRSLGVIAGMTGCGGTVGAVVTQLLLFSGSRFSRQTSISLMGFMIILCTLPVSLLYFPQSGGMFCGPSCNRNWANEDTDSYRLLE